MPQHYLAATNNGSEKDARAIIHSTILDLQLRLSLIIWLRINSTAGYSLNYEYKLCFHLFAVGTEIVLTPFSTLPFG